MKQFLKMLLSFMALIPQDKLLHFFYGSLIATPIVILLPTLHAVCLMVFISMTKEIVDSLLKFSPPNFLDAIFTFVPTLLLLAVKLIN
jgi:hypothetical protein